MAGRKITEQELKELVRGAIDGRLDSDGANRLASHDDWSSLVTAVSSATSRVCTDNLNCSLEVLELLKIENWANQVEGLKYETIQKGEGEDSLDVRKRLHVGVIGPLARSSKLIALQMKDADIVSGVKPPSMPEEAFTKEYIHPAANEETIAKIVEFSNQWFNDMKQAHLNNATLLGIVEDVEESTKSNIEILYSLGFDLKKDFVPLLRLHYFDTNDSVKSSSEFVKTWLKEKDGIFSRPNITKLSERTKIPYEKLLRIARDEIIVGEGEAFYAANGILDVNGKENPYNWENQHVVGIQRSYVDGEISLIIRGKSQLDYAQFKAFDTNLPSLTKALRADLLPKFYGEVKKDVWLPEWGPKPSSLTV